MNQIRLRILLTWMACVITVAGEVQPEKGDPPAFKDYLMVPLRIHLLSSETVPDWNTTLTDADMDRILGKINQVWSQAGIHLYLESLVREKAVNQDILPAYKKSRRLGLLLRLRPGESRDPNMLHLYYVKELHINGVYLGMAMFVKDTASLRKVPGGIDEPIPRVSSHEIGHAFTLNHRQNRTNLMASGTTGTALNTAEIEAARKAARGKPWILSAPDLLKQADLLHATDQKKEASRVYRWLMGLPLPSAPEVLKARKRGRPLQ